MVPIAKHYALLKNRDVPANVLISQQQLILNCRTWYQLMLRHRTFIRCSDMQIIKFECYYQICMFIGINENIRNERKINGGIQAKFSTSQLVTILYYQHWFVINTNAQHVSLKVQYANYLKIVFMNIN